MQNQCGDAEAWRLLHRHKQQVAGLRLSDAFEKDPGRAQRFSLELQDLFVDFSKNLITDETRSLLLKLAEERELKKRSTSCLLAERSTRRKIVRPCTPC